MLLKTLWYGRKLFNQTKQMLLSFMLVEIQLCDNCVRRTSRKSILIFHVEYRYAYGFL